MFAMCSQVSFVLFHCKAISGIIAFPLSSTKPTGATSLPPNAKILICLFPMMNSCFFESLRSSKELSHCQQHDYFLNMKPVFCLIIDNIDLWVINKEVSNFKTPAGGKTMHIHGILTGDLKMLMRNTPIILVFLAHFSVLFGIPGPRFSVDNICVS